MVQIYGLDVADSLFAFVGNEALPGTGLSADAFWRGTAALIRDMSPRIRDALSVRDELQQAIDAYHRGRSSWPTAAEEYEDLLRSIGYLVTEPETFTIETDGVDAEIATIAGPQLVVPLSNARFAVNAANARWGSLYDALYGTDAIDEDYGKERVGAYNPIRGVEVIRRGREFLDEHLPLVGASHADVDGYAIEEGVLVGTTGEDLHARLAVPEQLVGYQGPADAPSSILLVHHGLHVEIRIDREHPIGSTDRAGISDVVLESAPTTIMDLEDSVAAVDVDDKVLGYRNWLHLMQGRLEARVDKGGRSFVRTMADDRVYTAPAGGSVRLPGRSLLLVRNVGHLMTTNAILDDEGRPVPEGIIDALMTALGGVHDLRGNGSRRNSRSGAIYIVKPKLHGPDEVALACETLARVEEIVGLPALTIKIGIMDEERRTSANLKACIYEARNRVAFINTGFLDRTGDEIHTSMEAGPVVRKADMKKQIWIAAYEDQNVDIGLECGFQNRAQIGKGMWAAPDDMAAMLAQKRSHPEAGANCAWVPSPTAATLHAIHYHEVDVAVRQAELAGGRRSTLRDLLTPPLADPDQWGAEDRREELDNNAQGVLGYVVRWVDAGVGCSKVPDLGGTPLMEDRATCRISSQHVANWLHHGVISSEDVEASLQRMALVVDDQNAGDPAYRPMAPAYDSEAFLAARELLLEGRTQPSGYTEPILHRRRSAVKRAQAVAAH